MGGALRIKQLLSLLGAVSGGHRDKKKRMQRLQLQTVELRVRMDCERRDREVKKALADSRGVQRVEVNRRQQKVTVSGNVDPHKVLRRAQSTGKNVEMWAQNPSYSAERCGPLLRPWSSPGPRKVGYRRNMDGIAAEHITSFFSDDNPNACSIM